MACRRRGEQGERAGAASDQWGQGLFSKVRADCSGEARPERFGVSEPGDRDSDLRGGGPWDGWGGRARRGASCPRNNRECLDNGVFGGPSRCIREWGGIHPSVPKGARSMFRGGLPGTFGARTGVPCVRTDRDFLNTESSGVLLDAFWNGGGVHHSARKAGRRGAACLHMAGCGPMGIALALLHRLVALRFTCRASR